MKDCSSRDTLVAKEDKFGLTQCPNNHLEIEEMQNIPYASAMESLMYAQVCMHLDIAFKVGMLGKYITLELTIGKQTNKSCGT